MPETSPPGLHLATSPASNPAQSPCATSASRSLRRSCRPRTEGTPRHLGLAGHRRSLQLHCYWRPGREPPYPLDTRGPQLWPLHSACHPVSLHSSHRHHLHVVARSVIATLTYRQAEGVLGADWAARSCTKRPWQPAVILSVAKNLPLREPRPFDFAQGDVASFALLPKKH